MGQALRDQNRIPVALGQSNIDSTVTLPFLIDSVTGRLLIDSGSSGVNPTFEYYAQNQGSYAITSTSYTAGVSAVKVFDLTGGNSLTVTLNFSGGLPTTKVLSGNVPAGLGGITTCTYNFTGRTIPLKTYS